MRDALDRDPQIVDLAREAIRRTGLPPIELRIRGGTDGSILTELGLPTPNLFCGMHEYHSRLEWVSAQDMGKSVETLVHLAQLWEERGA